MLYTLRVGENVIVCGKFGLEFLFESGHLNDKKMYRLSLEKLIPLSFIVESIDALGANGNERKDVYEDALELI